MSNKTPGELSREAYEASIRNDPDAQALATLAAQAYASKP
jgi:hypothetical protein